MKSEYSTYSLSLAAALLASHKAKLARIEFPDNSNRALFIFSTTSLSDIEASVSQFWSKEFPVDANSYFESLKIIKSRLYEGKHVF